MMKMILKNKEKKSLLLEIFLFVKKCQKKEYFRNFDWVGIERMDERLNI